MNLKSEKGFTGIDISVAVVIIFIFIALISLLIYQLNSSASELELKSEATYLAINEIENIKNEGFSYVDGRSKRNGNSVIYDNIEFDEKKGFFKTVTVKDYTDEPENSSKLPNLVKTVTVEVSYMFKAEKQTIKLSEVITKGD